MSTASQTHRPATFPRRKIRKCVEGLLPPGTDFELRVKNSLDNTKIVHVVTEAWANAPNTDRNLKVIKAVRPVLSEAENDRIFYFSVLTPAEYAEIVDPGEAGAK